jgi:4-hydroxy-tetrahydrodipicolinate synthase
VRKLSRHPNIIGLKDSERDLGRLDSLVNEFGERQDFVLMCGWTLKSAETLLMGFDGIVPSTANVIPEKFSDLYSAVLKGDREKALELQKTIDPIAELHQKGRSVSWSIAGLKAILHDRGFCEPWMQPPLCGLQTQEEKELCGNFRRFTDR